MKSFQQNFRKLHTNSSITLEKDNLTCRTLEKHPPSAYAALVRKVLSLSKPDKFHHPVAKWLTYHLLLDQHP